MKNIVEIGIVFLLIAVILAASFSFILNSPLDHNEHMYVAAGKLLQTERLYTDFAFLQMPYIAVFYGLIFKLLGSGWYFLAARLCSFFFLLISCLLVYFIAKNISGSRFISLLAVILFSFNEVVILTMKEASNYNMAMAFSLLALYVFTRIIRAEKQNSWSWCLCGLALALAAGIKLYHAVSILPFLLIVLILPGGYEFSVRLKKIFLPFGLGLFAGILPLLYFLIRDFDNFIFNNLGYHQLNSQYFVSMGFTTGVGFSAKFSYFLSVFKLNSNLAILLCLIALVFFILYRGSGKKIKFNWSSELVLMVLLVFVSAAGLFFLTPLWIQYFSFLIPFFILLVISLYPALPEKRKTTASLLMGVIVLMAVVAGGTRLFRYADRIVRPGDWMVVKCHHSAESIRKNIPGLKEGEKIVTLSPIFVLDDDMEIYSEFSSGPFLYRIGHLLSEDQLAEYRGVSPRTLQSLFNKDQPRAFLVGHESRLEKDFIQYARQNGYKKVTRDFFGLSLFVK